MKAINLGKISVPLDDYASQGNAILGIRDSGKSYTGTGIAERLMDSGIPIIAFDPIGIWRYLRVPGAGKGYEVVVAGGKQGDLPLTPLGAQEIVRAAMRENVSLVVDLYDIHLSKNNWRDIVASCIRTLLYENGDHGLRHIFIEEAAEFCPQNIGKGQEVVYAEVEKLARMGGNALLGYTLINQRAEQVNKAVLELCDCLILHRQKGKNSINALSKWLDLGTSAGGGEISKSLPTLGNGECWVWPAGSDAPVRTKIPQKHSFHPDRRARQAAAKGAGERGVDVSGFVATMKGTLEAIVKEAEANDPKRLKAELATARAEISRLTKAAETSAPLDAESVKRSREEGYQDGFTAGLQHAQAGLLRVPDHIRAIRDAAGEIERRLQEIGNGKAGTAPAPRRPGPPAVSQTNPNRDAPARQARAMSGITHGVKPGEGGHIPRGERAILIACAQTPGGCTREQLTQLTGYKRSSRDAYIQRLREKGYVEDRGSIEATDAGIAALGSDYEPLPTGDALLQHWLPKLPEGERRLLQVLTGKGAPAWVSREDLDAPTGYARSSRDTYLQRLNARKLIEAERGQVRASEALFG